MDRDCQPDRGSVVGTPGGAALLKRIDGALWRNGPLPGLAAHHTETSGSGVGERPLRRSQSPKRLAPHKRKHVGEAEQVSDQQNQEDDEDGADHGADRALPGRQFIELTRDLA